MLEPAFKLGSGLTAPGMSQRFVECTKAQQCGNGRGVGKVQLALEIIGKLVGVVAFPVEVGNALIHLPFVAVAFELPLLDIDDPDCLGTKGRGRKRSIAVEKPAQAECAEHVDEGTNCGRSRLESGSRTVVTFAVEHHDAGWSRWVCRIVLPAVCLLVPRLQGVETHGEVVNGESQRVLQVVSMIHQCHPRLVVHLEPKLSVECGNHVRQVTHGIQAVGLAVGPEIRVGQLADGRIVHGLSAAIRRKLVVAQGLVDGQQGKVRNRGGGEAGVVATVQGTVDASLENGAGGLGTGGVHGGSNL